MINALIAFSVRNKTIICLLTLGLFLGGLWAMRSVPLDAVPDITNNQVQIITQAPDLGTEDVERFITYPVEMAVANLPDMTEVRSVSRSGLSIVTVVFKDEIGTYLPRQLVTEKLEEVRQEIPAHFGQPSIGPITTGLGEIYQYTLKVDPDHKAEFTPSKLREIQDWIVKRQMALVSGVVEVNGFGGQTRQYEVAISPERLRAVNVTIHDIFRALESNNANSGGAYIEHASQAQFIRGEGLAESISDIELIVVAHRNGVPIKIRDVATVRFGKALRFGAITKDGEGETVGGMVMMLKGENSNGVIERVKTRMAQINKTLPEGVQIEPFLDRSKLIEHTTSTVKRNLAEGGLIVIFVLILLLGNWRSGLIVASTIPLSLLFAFLLMKLFGVSANLMSLGAIDFGIIVDGAVIIVEATVFAIVTRVSSLNHQDKHIRPSDEEVISSSQKMMGSAFFGQLIILMVFLPILALEGVEGKMFKPMALTFSFAMIGAIVLCLTWVPVISALFLRVSKTEKQNIGDRINNWFVKLYGPMLENALKNTSYILIGAFIMFTSSVAIFRQMGGEFIPKLDEGDLAFHVMLKSGSSLTESVKATTEVEKILKAEFPEIEHVISKIGVADVPTDPMPMDLADCFAILKPQDEWESAETKEELIEKIEKSLSGLTGLSFEFSQPIEMRFNELLTGVREDIAIKVFGEDLEILALKADEIQKLIAGVEGVGDLRAEATLGLPQLTVKYNRDQIARYGLNIDDLNDLINTAFAGGKAGEIFEGERKFDLVVRLDHHYRQDIDNLRNLYLPLPNGQQIPLREVATIRYQTGPMQISRDNTRRRVYVGVNVRGRDVESVIKDISKVLEEKLQLPAGYSIQYGGAFENLERAKDRLQLVIPLALGVIFLLIFLALKSFKQSLIIFVSIPLASIGGIYALWLRDMPFSISAGIGFIVLFGVAVLNGLVLINGFNELKEEGKLSLLQLIIEGSKRRIRPIMLTASTDILGFLPMALSNTAGAEVQRPLATVVIGGLFTSTLLTLFVIPVLYKWWMAEKPKDSTSKGMTTVATALTLLLVASIGLIPQQGQAQDLGKLPEISLEEAISRSKTHPQLKAKQLEIERRDELKQTAVNLGNTTLFTSADEISRQGINLFILAGIQQNQMQLLGINSRKEWLESQRQLASLQAQLTEREIEKVVKERWYSAHVAQRSLEIWSERDSLVGQWLSTLEARFEQQSISDLEMLEARNRLMRMKLYKQQSQQDLLIRVVQLNQWLGTDSAFIPTPMNDSLLTKSHHLNWADSISMEHPLLATANQELAVNIENIDRQKANRLPTFNIQYGVERVQKVYGFHNFQAGVNFPLFTGQGARIQASQVAQEIALQNLEARKLEANARLQVAVLNFQKWEMSLAFFQEQALPLAQEQLEASANSYELGAISLNNHLLNTQNSLVTQQKYLDVLQNYLMALVELEYLTQ